MEKPTRTLLGDKARQAILRGVNAIYEPVRLTLGPEGGNALLYRTYNRGSRITNDGKTIADCIEPKDEFENLAAKSFKESAILTNQKAGDGTTSTIVIAGKLINEIFGKISESSSTIRTQVSGGNAGVQTTRRDMQEAMAKVLEKVKERAKKVETLEDLEKIAVVSVEDAELGKIVSKMVWEVGVDGFIDLTDGYKGEIETEIIKGMRFPAKPGAKAFVNNPARFEMIAQDVPCAVTNQALTNAAQIAEFTQHLKTSKLAIFAPSFSENVLVNLVNAVKNGFFVFPIAVPSLRTEQFEDLAVYLGASFINKDKGQKAENIRQVDLGFAEKIVVKDSDAREDAVVIGGDGTKDTEVEIAGVKGQTLKGKSKIADRIETLQAQIEETRVDSHKKMLQKRIASMSSAIGLIRVGSPSEAESLYKKLKIEDAAYACKAALQEGYVRGGGLCLKEIAEELDENVLTSALKAPYEQIQANAEGNLEIGEDVIDPAKVVRLSVEHAVSVSSHLVTAKIIVPEERDTTPGDGYKAIAAALNMYNRLWNKKEAIWKENELEMRMDEMHRNEELIANDPG